MDKSIIVGASILFGFAALGTIFIFSLDDTEILVSNFSECVEAGNPVALTYPAECTTKDGSVFIDTPSLPDEISSELTPTSADGAPEGSIHNLPVPQGVAVARTHAAARAGVSERDVLILTAFDRMWSDQCLGLGTAVESCALSEVSGYEVTLRVGGDIYIYHTSADGSILRVAQ